MLVGDGGSMSLIMMVKSIGLMTEPCGTPRGVGKGSERIPWFLTFIVLFERKFFIKDAKLPVMPKV